MKGDWQESAKEIMNNKKLFEKIAFVTQFSLSLITPAAVCILISIWIERKYQTGTWVIVIGILFGIASMVNTFYRFYKKIMKDTDKEDPHSPGSNRHY